ncbi:C6 transcription factor [Fonsecaea pedrosoi]|nr:C6 transcription factor [Fonsecaea pedrosoi]
MTLDSSISTDASTDITSIASWDLSPEATTPASNGSRRNTHQKTRTLAPNLTRRSHKKSRGGCFSSATFSILDMRFFHHFLTIAYPHLPVDNDHVWVNDIPQFAEQHEYLMHALLSLGASHLSRLTGVDYRRESLIHRGQAIAGLNHALSQTARSYGEADAMLASCYALTFQASYMSDGLSDFITMVRGCALTTEKIKQEHSPTAFNLQPDWHFKYMAPRLQNLPAVDPLLLQDAYTALEGVRPFLTGGTEIDFHEALVDVITSLQASPASGYMQFIGVYGVWYELCHDSFKTFLDPNNLVAQLLLAYFVGVQLLMVPLATQEWPHRADGTVEWAQGIFQKLGDSEWEAHLDWPRNVIATVVAEINGEVLQLPPVLQLHLATRDITPQSTILTPT